MYYASSAGETSKRDLDADDRSGIRYLYREGFTLRDEAPIACGHQPGRAGQRSLPISIVLYCAPAALLLRRRKSAP
jgi:hypothetical protein